MNKRSEKTKALKEAFKHTIPVFFGYIFMGIAFGALLSSKGYSFWWATLMAIVIYAGSMQFVAVSLLSAAFNPLNTLLLTFMINFRHVFYGLSLFDVFELAGKYKPYMIFSLTDETFSLLCSKKPKKGTNPQYFYFYMSLLDHIYWITGCTIGAVAQNAINFNSKGIDFAMTALFIVIFLDQWKSAKDHNPALIGISTTAICLFILGKDNFLIPALIILVICLLLYRMHWDKLNEEQKTL